MVSHDNAPCVAAAPTTLDQQQLALIAGGMCDTAWCQVGRSTADAYQWAVSKTTDFYEWLLG
jgi:hypothetical protein